MATASSTSHSTTAPAIFQSNGSSIVSQSDNCTLSRRTLSSASRNTQVTTQALGLSCISLPAVRSATSNCSNESKVRTGFNARISRSLSNGLVVQQVIGVKKTPPAGKIPALLPIIAMSNSTALQGMIESKEVKQENPPVATIFEIPLPQSCTKIVCQYMEHFPLSMTRNNIAESLAYLRNWQNCFKCDDLEGYRLLADWLAHRILVTPKGRTSFVHNFEKQVLTSLTDTEIVYLRHYPEILALLSVQHHPRSYFSIRIIAQLIHPEEESKEEKFKFLARFLGAGECPLDLKNRPDMIRNSYASHEAWRLILQQPGVLVKIAEQADLIEKLDLRAPFTVGLINKAIELDHDKGLALLCRSYSCPVSVNYQFDEAIILGIATRFKEYLLEPRKPLMCMDFSSPLWMPIYGHLKANPLPGKDAAMEWFIATMNLGTHWELQKALEFPGYTIKDLTDKVCRKITCLKLDEKSYSYPIDFISKFRGLQELWIRCENISKLPENCKKLKHLTVYSNSFLFDQEMLELERFEIKIGASDTEIGIATLPESLPKLEHFISHLGTYKMLPQMPKLKILELYNTHVSALPNTPELKRLIVHNNFLLKEVVKVSKIEVVGLENCPRLSRFFANSHWGLPRIEGKSEFGINALPATLIHFYAREVGTDPSEGNPHIMTYCERWNEAWIEEYHQEDFLPSINSRNPCLIQSSTPM